jgi:hypothetical protein
MPEPVHCPHCGAFAVRLNNQAAGAGAHADVPPAPPIAAGRPDNWKFWLLGSVFALVGLLALGHALGDLAGQDWSDLADTLIPSVGGFCPLGLLGLVLLLALAHDGERGRGPTGPRIVPTAGDSQSMARWDLYECAACGARFSKPPDASPPPGPGRPL